MSGAILGPVPRLGNQEWKEIVVAIVMRAGSMSMLFTTKFFRPSTGPSIYSIFVNE